MTGDRLNKLVAPLTVLAALLLPVAAFASPNGIIRDCSEDGVLNHHYSQGDLQGALNRLPSDLDEYTDCRSVIRQAALAAAGGNHGGPKGLAGVDPNKPPSSSEQRRIDKEAQLAGPVQIGEQTVRPGDAGFLAAGFGTHLPPLLLAILIAFGAALVAGAAFAAERRWPGSVRVTGGRIVAPFVAAGRGVMRGVARFRR